MNNKPVSNYYTTTFHPKLSYNLIMLFSNFFPQNKTTVPLSEKKDDTVEALSFVSNICNNTK